jgi:broad specificity phosphatase PhoE
MKSLLKITLSIMMLLSMIQVSDVIAQEDVTTIILVRHAEKVDDSRDPELSEAGKQRAQKLAQVLDRQSIDVIYSTDYIRTKDTCAPVSALKNVEVKLYDPRNVEQLNAMAGENAGKTILVCGHSNSTPRLANHFLKADKFADFDESDYGNILIVTMPAQGNPDVVHLRY